MANNTFTDNLVDGQSLTENKLETALQTLKLDLAQTTQMTSAAAASTFLQAPTPGSPATWGLPLDPKGPFSIRNYGLAASVAAGALTVALKSDAGTDPTSTDLVDIAFSSNGTLSATTTELTVTGALSITLNASASLGVTNTAATRVFVYAINSGGTVKLALSGRSDFDAGAAVTTVALAASADTAGSLYATAASAVVPRLLGWVQTAFNASSLWTAPTKVNLSNHPQAGTLDFGRFITPRISQNLGGMAISNSCDNFFTSSSTFVDITNLAVTLTTSGRPIIVALISDANGVNPAKIGCQDASSTTCSANFRFIEGANVIADCNFKLISGSSGFVQLLIGVGAMYGVYVAQAGTYTIKAQALSNSTDFAVCQYAKLVAFEI